MIQPSTRPTRPASPGTDWLSGGRGESPGRLISLRVEDRPGVLQRVTNCLGRRGMGIEACAVGPSSDPGVVGISLRVDAGAQAADQIVKQLTKLIDVVSVEDITSSSAVEWSCALVSLSKERAQGALPRLPEPVTAQVVKQSGDRALAALAGPPGKVALALELIGRGDDVEWICSGALALVPGRAGRRGPLGAQSVGGVLPR